MLGREVCRFIDENYYDTRYNNKGQVIQTSYPYANLTDPDNTKIWSEYFYDNFGRKTYEISPYCSLSYSYNNRKITTTDHLRGISTWKYFDALGRITQAQDPGGTIIYSYSVITSNSKPRHRTQVASNGAITTIETDLWGNRLKITEPNAGTITSEYNKFNELIQQTDANGNITFYTYDPIGRITSENFTDNPNHLPFPPSVLYHYDTGNKALGKVSSIEVAGKLLEKYTYDNLGRVASKFAGIGTFYYTYNQNGQLQQLKYPGGDFAVDYEYTTDGKLKEIRRNSDSSLIYKVNLRNKYQQPIRVAYGNNHVIPIVTQYNYNDFGMITGIKTTAGMQSDTIGTGGGTGGTFDDRGNGVVMNYVYDYNEKGLMISRTDNTVNQNERYIYDNLDRLTKNTYYNYRGKKVVQNFTYQPNGNILSNSQVGEYIYDPVKKHAVTQIECPNPDLISQNRCDVVYNCFNQPTQITEGDRLLSRQIELSYGTHRQRNKAVFKENDTVVNTHYYSNKYYERVKDAAGNVFYHHYIYGDGDVVALHIGNRDITIQDDTLVYDPGVEDPNILLSTDTDTTDIIYYIHTDHLGSYCALTDIYGTVVQRNSFDPWGNYAFEQKYICSTTHPRGDTLLELSFPITRRGFTGHEHYPQFKIINMNGRLYDPVIGRFFSPDKYVANSSFTQDYNRYNYARNNPLAYTDPSGDHPILIAIAIGAAIAAASYTVNVAVSPGGFQNWSWSQFAINTVFGGIMGGMSAGIGLAMTPALTSAGIGGFWAGAITGATTGAFTGTMSGLMQYGMTGNANAIWKSGLMGMGMGGLFGGISGGIQAKMEGKTFWNGSPKLTLEEKFAIFVENNKAVLNSKFGESEIGGAYLANNENLAALKSEYGIDYRLKNGNLINSAGQKSNGFYVSGHQDVTTDGFDCYFNNDIYVSPNSVRSMWRGSNRGIGTLGHEWRHSYQLYNGDHARMLSVSNNNFIELQTHRITQYWYPTNQRLNVIRYYEWLLGLP
jgi:RHS repeat-associated protein